MAFLTNTADDHAVVGLNLETGYNAPNRQFSQLVHCHVLICITYIRAIKTATIQVALQ
jgi:hypothetical protein